MVWCVVCISEKMEIWKLILVMSAAFVLSAKGRDIPATEESIQHVHTAKYRVPIISDTEEEIKQMEVKGTDTDVIHTDLNQEQAFDAKTWVETVLKESYSHLSNVDIYMVKPGEMSEIMDHLMRGLISMNSRISEDQSDCIVLVYLYGGMRYLYKHHLLEAVYDDIVKALNRVLLHVPLSQEVMSNLRANQNISQLMDLIYEPVSDMVAYLDYVYGTLDVTEYMFATIDKKLHYAEIRHESVHDVTIKLVSLISEWLEKVHHSHSYFDDVPCSVHVTKAWEKFQDIISRMQNNLQFETLHDFILQSFGPESATIAEALAERLAMFKNLWKVTRLLQAVQFEKVSVSIENNEFVPEHVKLHQGNNTAFGYIVDIFLDISRSDYLINKIMEHLEHSTVSELPFTTPASTLHLGDLLPITQQFAHSMFKLLPQKCLDIKMLAALPGLTGVKREAFSPSNPYILSVLYKTWAVVTSHHPQHNTPTFKEDFWHKSAQLIDMFYVESLQKFMEGMESITGGELLSESLAPDSMILISHKVPETLREIFQNMVEIHVRSLLEDTECEHHGKEAYQLVVKELEKFAHHLHMEPSYVETHLCELLTMCDDKELIAEVSVVLSDELTSAIAQILSEVFDLISMWYTSGEMLGYYRTTFADFIGATAAKFIHLQLHTFPSSVSIPPAPEEQVQVNQNLQALAMWQHLLIEHLYTSYMDKLNEMTSLGDVLSP